jgi:cytochrome b
MALRNFSRDFLLPMPVWDRATRLFHWLLVVAVVLSYGSAWSHRPALHRASGDCVLALLLFRLAWGFLGSDTARFANFLADPRAVRRQLRELPVRAPDRAIGHTAACGWMAVIILVALAVVVGTGLVPMAAPHVLAAWILLILVALHLIAIPAYAVLKGQNLVRPMITGRKRLPGATPAPRMVNQWLAFVILLIAGALTWVVSILL